MFAIRDRMVKGLMAIGPRFLPFADAATTELPLSRLLRLSLFQMSVGMATVLLTGTLNRVMIVELGLPAWLVAVMVAAPLLVAPFRALIGHKSDTHRSAFGWRRVPYVWYGTLLQFMGLSIMPFALMVLADAPDAPGWLGPAAAALAFFLVGAGLHTTQTAGLALASDLAPQKSRPRVIALLYVMLLVGTVASALAFGWLLAEFTPFRLVQVVQGAAGLTLVFNFIALWQQEPRDRARAAARDAQPSFSQSWRSFRADRRSGRLLVAVALGAAGFSMQDILLEPYGGEILKLSVSATTTLSALSAAGTLAGLVYAARALTRGADPHRLAAFGVMVGVVAFSCVIFSSPFGSPFLFRLGAALIGFGGGLFTVCTLIAAMDLAETSDNGVALGAWGAVQATAAGLAIAAGGAIADVVGSAAKAGLLGVALQNPATGYSVVYHLEIAFLFVSLVALGPLVRRERFQRSNETPAFGLAELPG